MTDFTTPVAGPLVVIAYAIQSDSTDYGDPFSMGGKSIVKQSAFTITHARSGKLIDTTTGQGAYPGLVVSFQLTLESNAVSVAPLIHTFFGGADETSPVSSSEQLFGLELGRHYQVYPDDIQSRPISFYQSQLTTSRPTKHVLGTLAADFGETVIQIDSVALDTLRIEYNSRTGGLVTVTGRGRISTWDATENPNSNNWEAWDDQERRIQPVTTSGIAGSTFISLAPTDTMTISNKTLIINETGFGDNSVVINSGTYTTGKMCRTIEQKLNEDADLSGLYTVRYNPTIRRFIITSTVEFYVKSTGTINSFIGFSTTSNSSAGLMVRSPFEALLTQQDNLGLDRRPVTDMVLEFTGNVAYPSEVGPHVSHAVPYRMRDIDATITATLPRFENDDLVNYARDNERLFAHVFFADGGIGDPLGTGYYTGFHFVFNHVLMETATVIGGLGPVGLSVSARAISDDSYMHPKIAYTPDDAGRNFGFKPISADQNYRAACVFQGVPTFAAHDPDIGANYVYQLRHSEWVNLGFSDNTFDIEIMKSLKGKLYLGGDSGEFYEYDPDADTWTEVITVASGSRIVDMVVFRDDIYVLAFDGTVSVWDGDTATGFRASGGGEKAYQLKSFEDKLYLGLYDGTMKVLVYDSSWTTSTSFAPADNRVDLEILNGKLFAVGGTAIRYLQGGSWTSLAGTSSPGFTYIVGHKGFLFCFRETSSGTGYIVCNHEYYDVGADELVSFNEAAVMIDHKPVVLGNTLCVFYPDILTGIIDCFTPHYINVYLSSENATPAQGNFIIP